MASVSALANDAYTVGWICAVPLEMTAATALLDEDHGVPQHRSRTDHNLYQLGKIGPHNVIISCLPSGVYGQSSATSLAHHMVSTFDSIKFVLMVGIGGGVPGGDADIRLGDVVISQPSDTFGGVVQYDFGKTVQEGRFVRTGALDKPPRVLLSALSQIRSMHMMKGNKISRFVREMLMKYPMMQEEFMYQGTEHDQLYEAEYDHAGNSPTCARCDPSKMVIRPTRASKDPVIHYGTIASGNQVMKHGGTRDKWRSELGGILCFEMEAAGLMDNFPCLVIRGICDYADAHKNDRWQKYAAATAAAYAKELLFTIPPAEVKKAVGAHEMVAAGNTGEQSPPSKGAAASPSPSSAQSRTPAANPPSPWPARAPFPTPPQAEVTYGVRGPMSEEEVHQGPPQGLHGTGYFPEASKYQSSPYAATYWAQHNANRRSPDTQGYSHQRINYQKSPAMVVPNALSTRSISHQRLNHQSSPSMVIPQALGTRSISRIAHPVGTNTSIDVSGPVAQEQNVVGASTKQEDEDFGNSGCCGGGGGDDSGSGDGDDSTCCCW